MRATGKCLLLITFLFNVVPAIAQLQKGYQAIYSGIPVFDDRGKVVSAHGANIIKDKGRYYLFGEAHSDTSNVFAGFNCYSSADLYNWKFEGQALPCQPSGKLGPNRVGERPKVLKCPRTGEYVMLMHVDTLGYRDQFIGYATSDKVTGPYTFHGPLLFNGGPVKKWDMGSFQDYDGAGYLLVHSGNIYKLSDDYRSIVEQTVKDMEPEGESPAMFKKNGVYFWLASHRTSWERNDNFYYTASSIRGPWTNRGTFAPKGTLTWNSQTSFVLPVEGSKDTTFLFMGDRWAFPWQASAATYVWQPLSVAGTSLTIPEFKQGWQVNTVTGVTLQATTGKKTVENTDLRSITYSGNWNHTLQATRSESSSDAKAASFSLKFTGTQVAWYGFARPDGGYARVVLTSSKGRTMFSSLVDMYCNYPVSTLKFLSPILKKDTYTLTVSVVGERGNWSDKSLKVYGSKGNFISIDQIAVD